MRYSHTYLIVSVSLCSVYLLYTHIYLSHKLMKTNSLSYEGLPSVAYLFLKCLSNALTRRKGSLYNKNRKKKEEVVYVVHNCRLDVKVLRNFCSATGYGWDFPDCQYRDVPLCFPQEMCHKLLLMAITDDNFLLSPLGLLCVRQSIKSHQPVDELKKGPFMLRVQVLLYRLVDAGVEVDVCLSAFSRCKSVVWESVITLLSKNKPQKAITCAAKKEDEGEVMPANAKQVDLGVALSTGPPCLWSFFDHWFLLLPAALFGLKSRPISSIWMLSACLAEIEKHEGVGVVTSPVNIVAHFQDPLLAPSKVKLLFWKCSTQDLAFQMRQHSTTQCHLQGMISRT
uniref:uncharacterized protein si:ch211-12e13.1 n=1 Tax=Doryrhamphus excisus TaxID=161450 RepID=UPI0025AE5ECC|nr:uncharacterized protein si:ch211-12e13.1 [Doryrhamphus excisus]XP_057927634.1 uncharacterized protein si:ch211-12e13.1 [Doryrhamphus excisus]XP_057927635.1 uncharacterized protein si:ch211-12e13.1 [Doryrhamphus excisus]XP_057927636.1 uncharacterized protein si:ch211-12e13.1 [Doryrhamphus excisus]XP_057927638.1 uncharacterized protein si:ch211-12e13.1 [Doryrhamphus excisus]